MSAIASLTERQQQVFRLAGEGYSDSEIASRLGLHKNTVKLHVKAVRTKLGVEHKRELVRTWREFQANGQRADSPA